jgi:hypothetical protein
MDQFRPVASLHWACVACRPSHGQLRHQLTGPGLGGVPDRGTGPVGWRLPAARCQADLIGSGRAARRCRFAMKGAQGSPDRTNGDEALGSGGDDGGEALQ